MSVDPVHENNTMVFIEGVYQEKSTYATSGTTLTFDTAPANGTSIDVTTHTQSLINVPVDASVTLAKMAANSVDSDQYVDGSIDTAHYADNSITGAELADNIAIAGTLGVTGAVTADAGVSIDNITIDGTEIDLSSGNLTLDSAGDIYLDADGADIVFLDGGTHMGTLKMANSNLNLDSQVVDKDIIFSGNDGGSAVTALTLDMSEGGKMTTSGDIAVGADIQMANGRGISFAASSNHSGMSSELLDDYEEGTCTMTISSTGTNPTITEGSTLTAYYTKVGNMVTVTGYTGTKTITNAGSGIAQISGLPFPCKSGAYTAVIISHNTMFTSTDTGYIEPTTSTWYPIGSHTTGGVGFPTGGKVLMFTVTYLAS